MTSAAPVNGRIWNSAGSTKGLGKRKQRHTNSAIRMTAAAKLRPMPGETHPQSFTLTMAKVSAPIPPVTSAASNGLGRGASWPGISGSFRQPTNMAMTPIGTLTMNIQRQFTATSSPPMTGPSAAARPPIAVQVRTAVPTMLGRKHRQQQAQRGRRHQRRARRLQHTKGNQHLDIVGRGTGGRRRSEQRDTEQKTQIPAIAFGEPSEEHEKRGVGDRIAV